MKYEITNGSIQRILKIYPLEQESCFKTHAHGHIESTLSTLISLDRMTKSKKNRHQTQIIVHDTRVNDI